MKNLVYVEGQEGKKLNLQPLDCHANQAQATSTNLFQR